jgi:hypothetical protein
MLKSMLKSGLTTQQNMDWDIYFLTVQLVSTSTILQKLL